MSLISHRCDLEELQATMPEDGYWYLASPYSSVPTDELHSIFALRSEAFADASEAAGWLIGNGVRVFSAVTHSHPISQFGGIDGLSHEIWPRVDKPFMQDACGMIALQLEGWANSGRIKAAVAEFATMEKPIHYMEWPIG